MGERIVISNPWCLGCPKCGAYPFEQFLEGVVARSPWPWWAWILPLERWRRPAFAVICRGCKEIVGYDDGPPWRRTACPPSQPPG